MKGAVLKLKKGREKSIINRHPWIFSGAVANEVRAEEGDVVKVISDKEAVLGYGFYSQKSQISCRMFYWGNDEVDFNTEEFWLDKLNKAFQLRKETVISSETNAYRLVHAEGDNLPGLIIDVYAEVTVLQVLVKGMEIKLPLIVSSLLKLGFANIYLKSKTSSTNIEDIRTQSQWLTGGIESPATIKENGLAFKVDFVDGQKTGFFLDQRSNRQLLQSYSKNKKVLNAFSYTGGFSVYALAGGAEEVISLD
ncbi:MAG: class I SAM-dependent methyltransferase, partial [Bacteroidetes bacterium]|nr:class I SAM-dependent methyltransferase [Bacteroidota bacterium]